jgi:hypothetical protein
LCHNVPHSAKKEIETWLDSHTHLLQLLTTALHVLYHKKGTNHEHIGWLCITSVIFVMQGIRPSELAIIYAIEQSKNLAFDENIGCS